MRQVRYVGPGEDPSALVVAATDTDERFALPITVELREALTSRGEQTHGAGPEPPPAAPATPEPAVTTSSTPPSISPRDIQVRVRSGEAPEVLAAEPGMTLDRVMRFAGPVLDERQRVASEAQRARARRNGSDGQMVPFGSAVEERLLAHDIDPATVAWDSRRRRDGQWIVTAAWEVGGRSQQAEWLLNLTHRAITPLDDTGADLLSDRPLRGAHPGVSGVLGVVPFPAARSSSPVDEVFDQDADPGGGDSPGHQPGGEPGPGWHRTAAPRDELVPTARTDQPGPLLPQQTPDAHSGDQDTVLPLDFATTVPLPHADDVPVGAAGPGAADPGTAAPDTAGPPTAASGPADEASADQPAARRAERPRSKRHDKPKVPSWDDILTGVRRKTD